MTITKMYNIVNIYKRLKYYIKLLCMESNTLYTYRHTQLISNVKIGKDACTINKVDSLYRLKKLPCNIFSYLLNPSERIYTKLVANSGSKICLNYTNHNINLTSKDLNYESTINVTNTLYLNSKNVYYFH